MAADNIVDSANFKGVTSNKHWDGLTGLYFAPPNDTIHANVMGNLTRSRSLILKFEVK